MTELNARLDEIRKRHWQTQDYYEQLRQHYGDLSSGTGPESHQDRAEPLSIVEAARTEAHEVAEIEQYLNTMFPGDDPVSDDWRSPIYNQQYRLWLISHKLIRALKPPHKP